jgi:hypothetical protein
MAHATDRHVRQMPLEIVYEVTISQLCLAGGSIPCLAGLAVNNIMMGENNSPENWLITQELEDGFIFDGIGQDVAT